MPPRDATRPEASAVPRPSASPPASRSDLETRRKAELHLHLRGAVPLRYLKQQVRKYPPRQALASAPPGQIQFMFRNPSVRRIVEAEDPLTEIDRVFRFDSFEGFLAAYLFTSFLVKDIEDFRGLIATVRRGLGEQNIAYAEVTVSLREYMQQGIALDELLGAMGENQDGEPLLRWIVDPVRNFGPAAAENLLERLLPSRPPSLIGLTLGGAEHMHPSAPFRRAFEIAREAGLRTTVHAGEALGPESVWDALRILEVERVGHGVRAAEDPVLVRALAERGIPLEVCPTSNIRTGVYSTLAEHPVRNLFESGVPITINTDDPTFFGVTLAGELAALRQLGFSWPEIGGLADNAFGFAFDATSAAAYCNSG